MNTFERTEKVPFASYAPVADEFDNEESVSTHSTFDNGSKPPSKAAILTTLPYYELATHFVAISVTLTVILVNFYDLYWLDSGGSDWVIDPDALLGLVDRMLSPVTRLKYLQFAAKIHELVMMSSLSFILIYCLHRRLLKNGIPFGFLDAPYMVGAGGGLRLIWTRRFRKAFSRGNLWLGAIFMLVTFLTLTLGPSSAIAMIPSLSWWPVKDPFNGQSLRVYIGTPGESPWPTGGDEDPWYVRQNGSCFDQGAAMEPDCPGAGWMNIQDSILSFVLTGSPTNATLVEPMTNTPRQLLSRPLGDSGRISEKSDTDRSRRVSTANLALNAAALGGFWRYVQDHEIGTVNGVATPVLKSTPISSAFQSLVYSQCHSIVVNQTSSLSMSLQDIDSPWDAQSGLQDFYIPSDYIILQDLPPREPRFEWVTPKSYNEGETMPGFSAVSVAVLPMELVDEENSTAMQSSLVVACTIDARWASVSIRLEPRSSSIVQSNISTLDIFEDKNVFDAYSSKDDFRIAKGISNLVKLPKSMLDSLNFESIYEGTNMSSMTALLAAYTEETSSNNTHFAINMDDTISFGTDTFTTYRRRAEEFIGAATGTAVADGMARYAYITFPPWLEVQSNISTDGFEYVYLFASNLTSQTYNTSIVFGDTPKEEAYFFEFSVSRYGYGYGFFSGDISVKIAIGFLALYLSVVATYLFVIFGAMCLQRYRRSEAWETIQSLVALAMNSEGSQYLAGMSAGIGTGRNRDTIGYKYVWKLDAKVRVMENGRLSLVIANGKEDCGERVDAGKKYI